MTKYLNVKNGIEILHLDGLTQILAGSQDPSIVGKFASIGSIFLRSDNGGGIYTKIGANNTEWLLTSSGTDQITASGVIYTDLEDYYTGSNVQDILSEIGETRLISGYDLTEPTSLPDLSFIEGTRTFNVSVQNGESNFYFWVNNHKYIKTTTQSVVIPDTTDTYYIYFDNLGVLQYVNEVGVTIPVFYENAITGIVYWNATAGTAFVGDERHGKLMDGRTHHYNHATYGARYESGLDITGLEDGESDYTNTTSGYFWDEDIRHPIALQTTHPFIYKLGNDGGWTSTVSDNLIGFKNGNNCCVNCRNRLKRDKKGYSHI